MPRTEQLARFVCRVRNEGLSEAAREALKVHVLDAVRCAMGALGIAVARALREQTEEFGGAHCWGLIGGGWTPPDRATFYNSALVRRWRRASTHRARGGIFSPRRRWRTRCDAG